jgi:hypothetical protein
VFENRVLRKILGPKRKEVGGGWRKLHNEELEKLHFSPNIISVIISRRMRWAGHVALMKEVRNALKIVVGKTNRKRAFQNVCVDGSVTLRRILEKQCGKMWTGLIWLRTDTIGRLL